MTSADIKIAIATMIFDYRRNVVVPNSFFTHGGRNEADLLVLRPSGWLEEVEIKVSVADFRRDFTTKIDKHRRLQHGVPTQRHCHSWREDRAVFDPENPMHVPFSRFGSMAGGPVAAFWDYSETRPGLLRKFWFAMPDDVFAKVEAEIPDYCGVIVCSEGVIPRIQRAAPNLKMARKLTESERVGLLNIAYHRYWNVAAKHLRSEETAHV